MDGAKDIKNFRPIRLVRCMYKLLSKVLVRRLAKLLGEVIGKNHNAFVEEKQILDVVLVAKDLVDDLAGNKREGILCNLDMEKAKDHVNWKFIYYMLGKLGFGEKWRRWMNSCITTTSFAVLVNGGPSFKATRRLRQGYPLSLILFIIVMEALRRLLERAVEFNLFKGINVGKGGSNVDYITHFLLMMLLFFRQPEVSNLLHLRSILLRF